MKFDSNKILLKLTKTNVRPFNSIEFLLNRTCHRLTGLLKSTEYTKLSFLCILIIFQRQLPSCLHFNSPRSLRPPKENTHSHTPVYIAPTHFFTTHSRFEQFRHPPPPHVFTFSTVDGDLKTSATGKCHNLSIYSSPPPHQSPQILRIFQNLQFHSSLEIFDFRSNSKLPVYVHRCHLNFSLPKPPPMRRQLQRKCWFPITAWEGFCRVQVRSRGVMVGWCRGIRARLRWML